MADACWAASLASLPLVGVGLVHAVLGRDLGAGLQPAYLLLAIAWLWRIGRLVTPAGRRALLPAVLAPDRRWLVIALAAILLAALISAVGIVRHPAPVVAAEAWPRFARQVVQLLIMIAFTVYAVLWTRGPPRWRLTTTCLAIGLASQLLYAPVQAWYAAGGAPWFAPVERVATSNPAILSGSTWVYLGRFTEFPRWRGTMCEPLYLGSYLLVVVPVLLAPSGRRSSRAAAVLVGLAFLGLVVLVLTWSRGAWVAAAVAAAVWYALRRWAGWPTFAPRRWLWGAGALVGIGLVLLVVVGPDGPMLFARRLAQVLDPADWSNLTRFYSAQAAWRAFLLSPVVGVGWGQFAYHFYALVDLSGLQSQFTWPVVNSAPLLILAETGLVGAVTVGAFLTVAWRRTLHACRDRGPGDRTGRLIAASVGAVAVSGQLMFFSQYNLPHLWVVLGLWLAALDDAAVRRADVGRSA